MREHTIPAPRLAAILRAWLERGHTLEELARCSGITSRTLDRIINGRSRWVRIDTADALLVAIGRPEAWHVELADVYDLEEPRAHPGFRLVGKLPEQAAPLERMEVSDERRR